MSLSFESITAFFIKQPITKSCFWDFGEIGFFFRQWEKDKVSWNELPQKYSEITQWLSENCMNSEKDGIFFSNCMDKAIQAFHQRVSEHSVTHIDFLNLSFEYNLDFATF